VGLLDDAIREHLDLKRRRGADPAEIELAERDALGPVRRNRESGPAEDPEVVTGAEFDPGLGSARDEPDEGAATDLAEEFYGQAEQGGAFAEADTDAADDDPFAHEPGSAAAEQPFVEEEDPHRTQLMSTVDIPTPGPATSEYDVEEAFAEEEADGEAEATGGDRTGGARQAGGESDEDVLEETPEFLQDTPDHDRLWFEQRPPRDFDFDG
jgi:hypothetical protein